MTETYYLIGFVACFLVLWWGAFLLVRINYLAKRLENCELDCAKLYKNYTQWNQETVAALKLLTEPPASKESKEVKIADDPDLEGYRNLRATKNGIRINYEDWEDLSDSEKRRSYSDLKEVQFKKRIREAEAKSRSKTPLAASPEAESPKKVDWEPDDYKDLSAGKFERFSSDDLEEVSHTLTDDELRKFGG